MKKRGKKAAFQLSITTIVILVIAMVMLILGISLVRKIMCGGMNIASETLEGARKQISSLFSEQAGEIKCQGRESPLTVIPGRANGVGCLFTPPEEKTKYTLELLSAKFDGKDVKNWFVRSKDVVTINYGESKAGALLLNVPSKTKHGYIDLQVKIKIEPLEGGQESSEEEYILTLEVRSLGWLRRTTC